MAAFKDFSFRSTFAQYSHKHSRYLCEVNGSTVWGRCRLKTLKLTLGPYVSAYFSYVVRREDCRTFLDCTLPFWMDALRASGRSLLMSPSLKNVTISFAVLQGQCLSLVFCDLPTLPCSTHAKLSTSFFLLIPKYCVAALFLRVTAIAKLLFSRRSL